MFKVVTEAQVQVLRRLSGQDNRQLPQAESAELEGVLEALHEFEGM